VPNAIHHFTYFQAVVIGLIQGVTELFPISSLGHAVLIPHWIGGSWAQAVGDESTGESPYLAFIVVLHVATALALLVYFWREWVKIVGSLFGSIRRRKIETVHERLAWLLVIATIPAGITGLAFEHTLRTIFAKPLAAAVFLTINGLILFAGEWLRRRSLQRKADEAAKLPVEQTANVEGSTAVPAAAAVGQTDTTAATVSTDKTAAHGNAVVDLESDAQIDAAVTTNLRWIDAVWIGFAQVLALFAGISRNGVTMVAGLIRDLDHEEAVRFAFLLATPIILAAGVLKIPDFTGSLGDGIRGQALAGGIAAFFGALFATRFLTRYFRNNTLTPFAIYCVVFGAASIIRFG
jgi:undecaprenyl-diphosphatase